MVLKNYLFFQPIQSLGFLSIHAKTPSLSMFFELITKLIIKNILQDKIKSNIGKFKPISEMEIMNILLFDIDYYIDYFYYTLNIYLVYIIQLTFHENCLFFLFFLLHL